MKTGPLYLGNDLRDMSGIALHWHYGNDQLDSLLNDRKVKHVVAKMGIK